jgi:hypothetical protein
MFRPSLYTIIDKGSKYGLHKFKDGKIYLVQQHASGDWQTLREPKESEITHFKNTGQDVVPDDVAGPDS